MSSMSSSFPGRCDFCQGVGHRRATCDAMAPPPWSTTNPRPVLIHHNKKFKWCDRCRYLNGDRRNGLWGNHWTDEHQEEREVNPSSWKFIPPTSATGQRLFRGVLYFWCERCQGGRWCNHSTSGHQEDRQARTMWCATSNSRKYQQQQVHLNDWKDEPPADTSGRQSMFRHGVEFQWCSRCNGKLGSVGRWGHHYTDEHTNEFDRDKSRHQYLGSNSDAYAGSERDDTHDDAAPASRDVMMSVENSPKIARTASENDDTAVAATIASYPDLPSTILTTNTTLMYEYNKDHNWKAIPPRDGQQSVMHDGVAFLWCARCAGGRGRWGNHSTSDHQKGYSRRVWRNWRSEPPADMAGRQSMVREGLQFRWCSRCTRQPGSVGRWGSHYTDEHCETDPFPFRSYSATKTSFRDEQEDYYRPNPLTDTGSTLSHQSTLQRLLDEENSAHQGSSGKRITPTDTPHCLTLTREYCPNDGTFKRQRRWDDEHPGYWASFDAEFQPHSSAIVSGGSREDERHTMSAQQHDEPAEEHRAEKDANHKPSSDSLLGSADLLLARNKRSRASPLDFSETQDCFVDESTGSPLPNEEDSCGRVSPLELSEDADLLQARSKRSRASPLEPLETQDCLVDESTDSPLPNEEDICGRASPLELSKTQECLVEESTAPSPERAVAGSPFPNEKDSRGRASPLELSKTQECLVEDSTAPSPGGAGVGSPFPNEEDSRGRASSELSKWQECLVEESTAPSPVGAVACSRFRNEKNSSGADEVVTKQVVNVTPEALDCNLEVDDDMLADLKAQNSERHMSYGNLECGVYTPRTLSIEKTAAPPGHEGRQVIARQNTSGVSERAINMPKNSFDNRLSYNGLLALLADDDLWERMKREPCEFDV